MDREMEKRITGISVSISTDEKYGGTEDPLYLGVICPKTSSREFPLRYKRDGTKLESDKSYSFGFGVVDTSTDHSWDATGAGKNGLEFYPLRWDMVSRVYIRKEPRTTCKAADDALIIKNITVFIWGDNQTSQVQRKWHFGNVYLDAVKVPFHLGNEFGAMLDLFVRH